MRLPASARLPPPPAASRPSWAPATSVSLWLAPLSRRQRPGALCPGACPLGGGAPALRCRDASCRLAGCQLTLMPCALQGCGGLAGGGPPP
eukprot:3276211-Alexandrium_andersonii.AAC.1